MDWVQDKISSLLQHVPQITALPRLPMFGSGGYQYEPLSGLPSRPWRADRWSPRSRIIGAVFGLLVVMTLGYWAYPRHADQLAALLLEPTRPVVIVQSIAMYTPDPASPDYNVHVDRLRQYAASSESHERYANVWGYQYNLFTETPASAAGMNPSLNKIFAAVQAMEQELEKSQGARWMLITDADTLIFDPAVSLEYLLPSGTASPGPIVDGATASPHLDPTPLILGNQDENGFNSGVVLLRIHELTLAMLRRMLDLEPLLEPGSPKRPSDQYLMGWEIKKPESVDVARAFYEIPQKWANDYWIHKDDGGQIADGVMWTPQLQVHLVNHAIWLNGNWSTDVVDYANARYAKALTQARWRFWRYTGQDEGYVIRQRFLGWPEYSKSLYATSQWWSKKAKAGIESIYWPNY